MNGSRLVQTGIVIFFIGLSSLFPTPLLAADRAAQIQQSATEWENCIKLSLQNADKKTAKDNTVRTAKKTCQKLKTTALNLMPPGDRRRMSATMNAALDNHVK